MTWYLLQTKPNGHTTARDHLRRQGFDVFLPLIIKTTKKNSEFVDTIAPLFPGYLFLGTSIDPVPWKASTGREHLRSRNTRRRLPTREP